MVRPLCWMMRVLFAIPLLTAAAAAADVPPSAELASLLGKWQLAVSAPQRYEIRGHRIVYNDVFETEKWSNITINYKAPQSVRFEIRPADIPHGATSRRSSRMTGAKYRIEAEEPHLWLWTTGECLSCIPGTGRLIETPIALRNTEVPPPPAMPEDPPHVWQTLFLQIGKVYLTTATGVSWFASDTPERNEVARPFSFARVYWPPFTPECQWPSLFAADALSFFDEFDWTITHRSNATILFEGAPRSKNYRDSYQRLFVIVEKTTGRPLAEKTIDPAGNISIVTTYKDWNLQPEPFHGEEELQAWDYEIFPLPDELKPLKHRRTK